MNIQRHKRRLLDLEDTLSARIGQEADQGRGEFIDSAHDGGDASVADEVASEAFTEAGHNSDVLQQVVGAILPVGSTRCSLSGRLQRSTKSTARLINASGRSSTGKR
jgi:hypothetical protein